MRDMAAGNPQAWGRCVVGGLAFLGLANLGCTTPTDSNEIPQSEVDPATSTNGSTSGPPQSSSGTGGNASSGGTTHGDSEGSSSDGPTTGGPDDEPQVVEFCDPAEDPIWQIESGGSGTGAYASYSCSRVCSSFEACTEDDGDWTATFAVVDQMGATIRWQLGDDLVLFHNGGLGTTYASGLLVDESLAAGHGVAMVQWDRGAVVDDVAMGWGSRPSAEPTDMRRLTGRIAAVIEWVASELSTGRFGTASCSAGSYVTLAARTWHGADSLLDYQLFVGGPPFFDLGWACGDETSPGGRCSNEPATVCMDDTDCPGQLNRCSPYANSQLGPLVEMADSIHQSSPDCLEGNRNPVWEASNLLDPKADWQLGHPVDFLLNVGPGGLSDAAIGVYPNAWDLAQALDGPQVGWHEQPGAHCDGFSSPFGWTLLSQGMGWTP